MKLDLGCGQSKRAGFFGIDAHEPVGDWRNIDLQWDLTDGLPAYMKDIEEIYSGHFFEHLSKEQVVPMLKECFRVLKPGGTIEIVVPDLDKVLQNFIMANPATKHGWDLDTVFGGQAHDGEYHKTGFWPERLFSLFELAGFSDIQVFEMEGWGQPCLTARGVKR